MKKSLMFFTAIMMSSLIQTAAHAEWIDVQVASINNNNQTLQVQRMTNSGLGEPMTVNLDRNAQFEGYQGIGDVKTGDRVRLDVESSFLGTKVARAIKSTAIEGTARSGVTDTLNQGVDSGLRAGASAAPNAAGRMNLSAGSRESADLNAPTNNNPPRPLLVSPSNPAGSNNPTAGATAAIGAEESVPSSNTQMNTGGSI